MKKKHSGGGGKEHEKGILPYDDGSIPRRSFFVRIAAHGRESSVARLERINMPPPKTKLKPPFF